MPKKETSNKNSKLSKAARVLGEKDSSKAEKSAAASTLGSSKKSKQLKIKLQ